MKIAGITEAKNNLSALIDGLSSGSGVLIVDRGRPVARLEPVATDDRGALGRLIREGLVRPRRRAPDLTLFSGPLPKTKDGSSVVEALLEDRREGR
ncbi:MAG TPA: type II toxin-antitoxin system prevent-host-death family antitoxin [Caulobacteraceae bacterium]|nr:type II toxin-antitoxin system prevent-host-death family antitoxin [Caulobacteraceae bacterium]